MSARLRLTLSYAGFLFLAIVGMVALLVYVLRFIPDGNLVDASSQGFVPGQRDLLEAFWPRALQVSTVLLIVGSVGGWFLAGYMLRPLDRLSAVAESVGEGSLDQRTGLTGSDEFGRLGRTFDSMLDSLQESFDEQERFTANVSHELRTPYAITRSLLDVALADPAQVDLPQLLSRLDATTRRGTRAVEALLTIATLDHLVDLDARPIDAPEVLARVIEDVQPLAAEHHVELETELGEGDFDGSEALVGHLAMNLVVNGIRHNLPAGGSVLVASGSGPDGEVEIRVRNTGPVVPKETAATLVEPFVRGDAHRTSTRGSGVEGTGLGLTIVARVARLHGATLSIDPQPSGGLDVRVVFPAGGGRLGTFPSPGAVR